MAWKTEASLVKHRPTRRAVRGFNLTQLAIVFGIIGLVLGAIWAAISQVKASMQVKKGSEELITIAQNMNDVYAEQPGVVGPSGSTINEALDQLKVFPIEMRQDQSTAAGIIFSPWDQNLWSGGNIVDSLNREDERFASSTRNIPAIFAEQRSNGKGLDQLLAFLPNKKSTLAGISPWNQNPPAGSNDDVCATGIGPPPTMSGSGTATGPAKHGATGSVVVYSDDCTGNETQISAQPCFGVSYFNIPQSACVNLLVQTSQSARGLQLIEVNGTAAPSLPVVPSEAANICTNGSVLGNNDIIWVYTTKL